MRAQHFAAVGRFEVVEEAIPAGLVTGLATPVSGARPCALALMAGPEMIACSAAAEFSRNAQARGVRLGWCGFKLGGLKQAVALADQVEVRCVVSNQVLAKWESPVLALRLDVTPKSYLSVEAMLGWARTKAAVEDVDQILPFALGLGRSRGATALIDAMFLYLLKRTPDVKTQRSQLRDYTTAESIRELWRVITDSDEYLSRKNSYPMGPFDPEFPFPLDVLDQRHDPPLVTT